MPAGPAAMRAAYLQLVEWATTGALRVEVERRPLSSVAEVWPLERPTRRKIVLVP